MIHLDTHTLLWYTQADKRLGVKSRAILEAARTVDSLYISSVVFWEIALLVSKKKITLLMPPLIWREAVHRENIQELSLGGDVAIQSVQLADLHADPADRFIAATAICENATLITADKKLLGWQYAGFKVHDATL